MGLNLLVLFCQVKIIYIDPSLFQVIVSTDFIANT